MTAPTTIIAPILSRSTVSPAVEEMTGRAMLKMAREEGHRSAVPKGPALQPCSEAIAERRRDVMRMKLEGLGNREIGRRLGCTESQVIDDVIWLRKNA